MFHALVRRRGATWVGRRAPGERLRTRPAAATSAAAEVVASAILLIGADQLDVDVLRFVVVATAAFVVATRAMVGAASAGRAGALALGMLAAIPVSIAVLALAHDDDIRVGAALVGLGFLPLIAGTLPALALSNLDIDRTDGRRPDVLPSLLTSALCGGLGVLAAIGLAGSVDIGDDRLGSLVPYVAAGMAVLAMAEVLGHHRVAAGFPSTVTALAAVATVVWGVQFASGFLEGGAPSVESAVLGAVIAASAIALGLLLSTALATPRVVAITTVDAVDAVDGPRLVAVPLAVFAAVAAAIRLVSTRPLWIDEVDTPGATASTFSGVTDAARSGHAHPPLLDALMWISRQAFGSHTWALRLPSLVAGILLVPAVYVTASRLFDRRVGLVAAAIVAVGPGFVWLSDQADPGSLAALLATLALLALTVALANDTAADWLLFGVAAALLLWSHQLAIVPVVVLFVAAGITIRKRRNDPATALSRNWLIAAVIAIAALVALLVYRRGFGPGSLLPPLEYATDGAPAAGRSVFGLTGIALTGLVGFHPPAVTARLLALWPLCMLASFVLLGRSWSRRGAVVVGLAVAPFAALLALQIAGAPRNPPFALSWTATAMPMIAIGAAYAIGHAGSWRSARIVGITMVALLIVASLDQRARVDPLPKYDISSAVADVTAAAGPGDVVIYAPEDIGDLVRHGQTGARVISAAQADSSVSAAKHVYIVGAFAWRPDDPALQNELDLVKNLSAQRTLTDESGDDEVKVWTFS